MSDVNCPHCKAILDTSYWHEYAGYDGACFDIQCSECDERFDVSTTIYVRYTIIEDEELEEDSEDEVTDD